MNVKPGVALIVGVLSLGAAAKENREPPPRQFMGLPLLFVEEFEKPSPERWAPTDPSAWSFIRDGNRSVYALFKRSDYKPKVRSPEGISVLKDVAVSDFVLDLWLRSTVKDCPHRDMCVFFGYQDPTHFYYVHFGLRADAASNTIHIVNAKPRASIARTRTKGTPWTEGYHHVRIVRKVESGTIEAYFDDMTRPAMTAVDKTFRWGGVGVGSFDDTGNVDCIRLWGKRVRLPAATTRSAGR